MLAHTLLISVAIALLMSLGLLVPHFLKKLNRFVLVFAVLGILVSFWLLVPYFLTSQNLVSSLVVTVLIFLPLASLFIKPKAK